MFTPIFSLDLAQRQAFATPASEGGGEEVGDTGGGDQPDPEPDPDPGLVDPGPQPPTDPCEQNPEAEGCAPEPPIDPCIEDPTAEGCEPPGLITPPPRVPEPPDDDCIYNPSLPKCAPIDGKCPEGFAMNEAGQCYPRKPCPPGFERRDNDETGACLPIPGYKPPQPQPPRDINIIITEINNQIRNYYTTATPLTSCTAQEKTIPLGPSTMAKDGVRVLATFEPCRLTDGGAILNLPDSDNNLKLVAVDLEGNEVHKAVEVDLRKVQTITNDQTLYNADFTQSITGLSPVTNQEDTIEDINSLFLLNDSPGPINLVPDNSMAFNAILTPS